MNRFSALLLIAALAGCSHPAAPPVKQYSMDGKILRLDADQIAVIEHKDIDGWMKAMTMEYPIRDRQEFAKLKAGEHIHATVNVQGDDYWVSNIRQYQSDTPAAANSAAAPKKVPKGN